MFIGRDFENRGLICPLLLYFAVYCCILELINLEISILKVKNYQLEVNSDKHITLHDMLTSPLSLTLYTVSLYALYWCMYMSVTCKIVDSIISAIIY